MSLHYFEIEDVLSDKFSIKFYINLINMLMELLLSLEDVTMFIILMKINLAGMEKSIILNYIFCILI